jgi:hypothetical protein
MKIDIKQIELGQVDLLQKPSQKQMGELNDRYG